ncbi:MAG: flagellar hook-length control protein FliK [Hungatella sp.]
MSGAQAERASFSEQYSGETVRMQTSEQVLGRDTAELLASRMPLKEGVLHLELEPVHLGKLTIQVAFESGRTAVTVMSSNAETLEILSRNAGQIAQILEDRTGQQTVVYTPQSSEAGEQSAAEKQGHQENRQDRQEHRNERDQSFAQQLRLGLV